MANPYNQKTKISSLSESTFNALKQPHYNTFHNQTFTRLETEEKIY